MSGRGVLVVGLAQAAEGFRALFPPGAGVDFRDKDGPEWAPLALRQRVRVARGYRTIHFFWGRVRPLEALALRAAGLRVITHFVGTDVVRLLASARKAALHRLLVRCGVETAAVHEALVRELAGLGIAASLLPFVGRELLPEPVAPLPERFAALCYVPDGRDDFFRLDWILDAARAEPELRFTVFPHAGTAPLPNVRYVARIPFHDMPRALDEHSVLVRLPRHDGLPQTRFEALARARPVVWTFPGEHTLRVATATELRETLARLAASRRLERDGRRWVLAHFALPAVRAGFRAVWGPTERTLSES